MKNTVRYEIAEMDAEYEIAGLTFSGRTCEVHTADDTTTVSAAEGKRLLREMRKFAKEFGLHVRETEWEAGE